MVDFRYHLVSLISVFIALSVGVILGAGPLQNAIGEALTSEAATLRDSNAELKQQAERAHVRAQKQDQAFNTLAPALLKNTLAGQNVAIVRTPGVTDAVYAAVTAKLQLSGAQLGTVLGLTNLWVDAQQNSYRSAFAQQISTYVKGVATGADADTALGVALSQVLRAGSTDPNNATLVQVMSESDTPLLEKSAKLSGAADVVLVLTPDARAPQASGDKKTDAQATAVVEYTRTMLVKLVETLASKGATVVAGAANSAEDAVTQLRAQKSAASTVDSLDSALGSINVPVAIANTLAHTRVDLGVEAGAAKALGDVRAVPKTAPAGGAAPQH